MVHSICTRIFKKEITKSLSVKGCQTLTNLLLLHLICLIFKALASLCRELYVKWKRDALKEIVTFLSLGSLEEWRPQPGMEHMLSLEIFISIPHWFYSHIQFHLHMFHFQHQSWHLCSLISKLLLCTYKHSKKNKEDLSLAGWIAFYLGKSVISTRRKKG